MIKNKIIALLTCGVLVTAGITSGVLILNKNINQKNVQNHVLLATPNLNKLAVVINTNVSPLVLYKSPNFNSNIESYISVGEMLNYEATSNPDFYKVTVQETGASGYISANNLQIIESGLNKASENMSQNGQVINVTTDVKLMSSPDVHSQILGSYKNDAKLIVIEKEDQWYMVRIGEQTGYMYQEYVGLDGGSADKIINSSKLVESGGQNNANILIGQNVFAVPNKILNVYSADNTKASVVRNLNDSKEAMKVLSVINNTNDYNAADNVWYKVELSNGNVGYVPQSLTYYKILYSNPNYNTTLFKGANTADAFVTTIEHKKVPMYVNYELINVFNGRSSIPGNFYKITLSNGMTGFMQ